MHALPGIENRALRFGQHPRRRPQCVRIGAVPGRRDRRIVERTRQLLVPEIGGNFDQHWSAAAVAQPREGAAHHVGNFGRRDNGLG
jgi:hypothetical protein